MTDVGPLARYVEPAKDENLPSFLIRVARANGRMLTLYSIASAVGVKLSRNPHSSFVDKLDALSALTRIPVAQLKAMSYPAIGRRTGGMRQAFGASLPAQYLNLNRSKICGACLKTSGTARTLWDLKLYRDCHVHKVKLMSECEKCANTISWFRCDVTHCHKCGFDFRNAQSVGVSADRGQFAGYIAHLSGFPNEEGETLLARVAELSNLGLAEASSLFSLLWSIQFTKSIGLQGFLAQDQRSFDNSLDWLSDFFGERWPKPFFSMIDTVASKERGKALPPKAMFPRLYLAVTGQNLNVNMPRFRFLFVRYLASNYSNYLARVGSAAGPIAEASELAGLITLTELERKVGASKEVIMRVAVDLKCPIFRRGGRYPVVRLLQDDMPRIAAAVELCVATKSANKVRARLLQNDQVRLSLEKLGTLLGCSDNVAASILAVGVVGKRMPVGPKQELKHVATSADVSALLNELESKVQRKSVSDARHIVDYSRRALCGGKQKYWLAHVIALVRTGYLVPCKVDARAVGLRRIFLSMKDGEKFLQTKSSLPEVVSLLSPYGLRDKHSNHILPFNMRVAA